MMDSGTGLNLGNNAANTQITPCGLSGNVIYYLENNANSGSSYNISRVTLSVS
jgi:hypothetical protein